MSLKRFVCKKFGFELGTTQMLQVYVCSVSYLLNKTPALKFQAFLKPIIKGYPNARQARLDLKGAGFTMPIKLFALAISRKNYNITSALKIAHEVGLSDSDAELIYYASKEVDWFGKELAEFAAEIPNGHEHETLRGVHATYAQVLTPITKYAKFLAWKKLRFLSDANNMPLSDFEADLLAHSVSSFYHVVPTTQTISYITNYLKRAMENHCTNMIKTATRKKRARIVDVGFDKNGQRHAMYACLSENQLRNVASTGTGDEAGVDAMVAQSLEGDDGGQAIRRFETQFSISEIITRYKATSRKHRLLKILLASEEDQEFSAWLRSRKLCKPTACHIDLQTKLEHDEYLKLVSKFLGASYAGAEKFLISLRQELECA